MAVVSTNIKIEQNLKKESQELFESFGLNLSSAINMFLRQSVREGAIPFRVGNPLSNAELEGGSTVSVHIPKQCCFCKKKEGVMTEDKQEELEEQHEKRRKH